MNTKIKNVENLHFLFCYEIKKYVCCYRKGTKKEKRKSFF